MNYVLPIIIGTILVIFMVFVVQPTIPSAPFVQMATNIVCVPFTYILCFAFFGNDKDFSITKRGLSLARNKEGKQNEQAR